MKINLDNNQDLGSSGPYSTTDHIHAIHKLKEKCRENHIPLSVTFEDYEKAFDSVQTQAILTSLQEQGIEDVYIEILKDIFYFIRCQSLARWNQDRSVLSTKESDDNTFNTSIDCQLRIASFNARSIQNSAFDIVNILNTYDILAVHEHWLPKQSLPYLNSVHPDFIARGINSFDYCDRLSGRPHGLCFLWRRTLDTFIEPIIYDDETRLLGLKITTSNATILLLNVYLPYQCDDNIDEYLAILGKIQAISDSFESTNIFIIGDCNANISKPSLFSPHLDAFINECNFIPSDIRCLPPDSFTYVSDAHDTTSWLDHVLTTHSSHSTISDMAVNYDCVSSDHFPLGFTISVNLLPYSEASNQEHVGHSSPKWDTATLQDLKNYYTQTGLLLSAINVPHDALCCTDPNCNDEDHYSDLCKFYDDITNLLSDAAGVITTKAHNSSSKHFVLGWNDLVSEFHQAARESFLIWRSAGSPRHGPLFDIMKAKRAEFKRKKILCEKNAETLKADRLASKLSCNDLHNFWKDIKKTNNAKLQTPSNVGGACGAENVRNMWLDHYQALLNSIPGSPVHISKIDTYCNNITFHDQMTINVKEICEKLKHCLWEKLLALIM